MRYTTLLVTDAGVVLFERHRQRLEPEGAEAVRAFRRFAEAAAPGTYSVLADGARLVVERRHGSRLYDGIPTRTCISPLAHRRGPLPKMPSPCAYDAVRSPGVATLLTAGDGSEVLEACVATVVGWDGKRFVLSPLDRPRVASVSEQAIRDVLPFVESPLATSSTLPLALVNAVKGICRVMVPGQESFPDAAAALVRDLFGEETRRR